MENQPSKHIGRKIWYGTAIGLCGLVILLCAIGMVGTWIIEQSLSDTAVALLTVVENTAGGLRQAGDRLDTGLSEVQQVTGGISSAAEQLSQNVADQGLVLTLLPEEQEQKLVAAVQKVTDTYAAIKDVLATGLEMYQTIDRLPFVSLPAPSQQSIEEISAGIAEVQSTADELRGSVQDFRSGAAAKVDMVTTAADQLTSRLQTSRDRLAKLDSDLAQLQDTAATWKETIPTLLFVAALVITLLSAYIIYTEVEVIRLYVQRWKGLGA